jgi:hypothetical protein
VITDFFGDDSGLGMPPVGVFAGFVAPAEKWEEFSKEWEAECEKPKRVCYIKMREAMSLTGQFDGWDERDRDARLRQFWAITKKYVDYGVVSLVEDAPYQAAFRGKLSKTFDHSYFYVVTRLMMRTLSREGVIERRDAKVSFVFDQQELGQKREILSWWEYMKLASPIADEVFGPLSLKWHKHVGRAPAWKDEKELVALQAADMLAWVARRNCEVCWNYGRQKFEKRIKRRIAAAIPERFDFELIYEPAEHLPNKLVLRQKFTYETGKTRSARHRRLPQV